MAELGTGPQSSADGHTPERKRNSMVFREIERRSPSITNQLSPTKSVRATIVDHTESLKVVVTTPTTPNLPRKSSRRARTEHPPSEQTSALPEGWVAEGSATAAELTLSSKETAVEIEESFFDDETTDEEEITSPKLAREASFKLSVRPKLIEARSSSSGVEQLESIRSAHASPPLEPGPTRSKAAKVLGIEDNLKEIGALTPSMIPRSNPLGSCRSVNDFAIRPSMDGPANFAETPTTPLYELATSDSSPVAESTAITSSSSLFLEENPTDDAAAARKTNTPSPQLSFVPSSIIELPSTPLQRAVLETLPSPMFGFGRLRGAWEVGPQHDHAVQSSLQAPGGTPHRLKGDGRPSRTASAPPLPLRRMDPMGRVTFDSTSYGVSRSKKLNRKVTIRPADIKAIDLAHANGLPSAELAQIGLGQHGPTRGWIRENIVSTPYPTRAGSLATGWSEGARTSQDTGHREELIDEEIIEGDGLQPTSREDRDLEKAEDANTAGESVRAGAIQNTTNRSTTTPSTVTLFVNMSIAGRPHRKAQIPIHIEDPSTFDDEQLFIQLRSHYKGLIGPFAFYCSARRLISINTESLSGANDILDEEDILKHFRRPSLGRKRKTYTNLLRQYQTTPHNKQERTGSISALREPTDIAEANIASQLSPRSIRDSGISGITRPEQEQAHITENNNLQEGEEGEDQSFHSLPPSTPHQPPHSALTHPFSPPPPTPHPSSPSILSLEFHHTFHPLLITSLSLLIFLLASLITVLWIIFGVPGSHPGSHSPASSTAFPQMHVAPSRNGTGTTTGVVPMAGGGVVGGSGTSLRSEGWKHDASRRVTTGVVLGILVLVGGVVGEGVWLWGSWVVC